MPAQSIFDRADGRSLLLLTVANGAVVSTLYWAQSMVPLAANEFGPVAAVALMPAATLAGYAIGVSFQAAVTEDLTAPKDLALHLAVLTLGLCAAAAAASAAMSAAACLIIGVGCSVTQRLLACATAAVPTGARAATIGWIIGAGLLGIVLARVCVPAVSVELGWRAMFWLDAAVIAAIGLVVNLTRPGGATRHPLVSAAPVVSVRGLWRAQPTLRRAALQQAAVFAAFNAGWATYPRLLAADGIDTTLPAGLVAFLGATAAILAGRACAKRDPAAVARSGLVAVGLALVGFLVAREQASAHFVAMALLDIGTQIALVANQARAQALASSPAMRGRIAATVTTVGFAGGALGAVVGNLLQL